MTKWRDPWGRTREEVLADARKRLASLEAAEGTFPRASMQAAQNTLCVQEWRAIVARLAQTELDFDA